MQAHGAHGLVETPQLVGAAENAEEAEHRKEANTPAPGATTASGFSGSQASARRNGRRFWF